MNALHLDLQLLKGDVAAAGVAAARQALDAMAFEAAAGSEASASMSTGPGSSPVAIPLLSASKVRVPGPWCWRLISSGG